MSLPNFKMLGIEKQMTEEFETIPEMDLQKLIRSSYFQNPHIIQRRENSVFCEVEVIECENNFWYKDLIGFQFFCEIHFDSFRDRKYVKDFTGVKLTRTKMIIFRSFSPNDVVII